MTGAERMEMFFRDPALEPPTRPCQVGTLYLLRRDIRDLERALPGAGIWPRTMLVLAGIDLVAKFYCDNDDRRGVGERFTKFVRERITQADPNPADDAGALYQFRNSLLHSFGLYSESGRKTYRFVVYETADNRLFQNDPVANPDLWFANLAEVERRFNKALDDYYRMIRDGNAPFSEALFSKYGSVGLR